MLATLTVGERVVVDYTANDEGRNELNSLSPATPAADADATSASAFGN